MSKSKVDFAFIKTEANFLRVLEYYGLALQGKGVQRQALCPFHQETRPSFKINLGRKIFHCFGCGAKGNVLEFVRRKEGLGEDELRKAARKVAEICAIPTAPPTGATAKLQKRHAGGDGEAKTIKEPSGSKSSPSEAPAASGEVSAADARNEPLSPDFISRFEAKLLREHPYFAERGLSAELVAAFGLGFFPADRKGMMQNRVVIPIHDAAGRILAWCGRWVGDDDALPEGEDRYKLPATFHKRLALFNLHRVKHCRHLTVVEGYFGTMRLHGLRIPAVALMGNSIAQEQVLLLQQHCPKLKALTVLLDGDGPGRKAAELVAMPLAHHWWTRIITLPEGTQPDTVAAGFLEELKAPREA